MAELFLFQDIDRDKTPRVMSSDPGPYLAQANVFRAVVVIDSVWDGSHAETVARQLTQLIPALRGPQGAEAYFRLIFRPRP